MNKHIFVVLFCLGLILGVWFGRTYTIKGAYISHETETSYVMNYEGSEHLYLK